MSTNNLYLNIRRHRSRSSSRTITESSDGENTFDNLNESFNDENIHEANQEENLEFNQEQNFISINEPYDQLVFWEENRNNVWSNKMKLSPQTFSLSNHSQILNLNETGKAKNFFTEINQNQASHSMDSPNQNNFNMSSSLQRNPNQISENIIPIQINNNNNNIYINQYFNHPNTGNITPEGPRAYEEFFDEKDFELNFIKDPTLRFMKELAVILEGRDQCAAVGWEGLDFSDEEGSDLNDIYVTCNLMGKSAPNRTEQNNEPILKNQETLVNNVLEDLRNGIIDLKDYKSCKNLLEIFFSNIIEHGKSRNNSVSFKVDDKKKYYFFLFFYLKKLRPKQIVREALGIPNLFAEPVIQQRMERFSIAVNHLLGSKFYIEFIKSKKIRIELKYQSESKVHAELKLIDFYIQKHIFNKSFFPYLYAKNKNEIKKKIYLAPSRLPCKDCRTLIQSINDLKTPLLFFFPIDEEVKVLKYIYSEPEFLKNLTENTFFEDFYKIKLAMLATEKEKESHDGQERIQILKDTDSAPRKKEISQYRMINRKFVSNFQDNNLQKLVLEGLFQTIQKFCDPNMDKDSIEVALKIRDYIDSLYKK